MSPTKRTRILEVYWKFEIEGWKFNEGAQPRCPKIRWPDKKIERTAWPWGARP
jgi:hypothetical protein